MSIFNQLPTDAVDNQEETLAGFIWRYDATDDVWNKLSVAANSEVDDYANPGLFNVFRDSLVDWGMSVPAVFKLGSTFIAGGTQSGGVLDGLEYTSRRLDHPTRGSITIHRVYADGHADLGTGQFYYLSLTPILITDYIAIQRYV